MARTRAHKLPEMADLLLTAEEGDRFLVRGKVFTLGKVAADERVYLERDNPDDAEYPWVHVRAGRRPNHYKAQAAFERADLVKLIKEGKFHVA